MISPQIPLLSLNVAHIQSVWGKEPESCLLFSIVSPAHGVECDLEVSG